MRDHVPRRDYEAERHLDGVLDKVAHVGVSVDNHLAVADRPAPQQHVGQPREASAAGDHQHHEAPPRAIPRLTRRIDVPATVEVATVHAQVSLTEELATGGAAAQAVAELTEMPAALASELDLI